MGRQHRRSIPAARAVRQVQLDVNVGAEGTLDQNVVWVDRLRNEEVLRRLGAGRTHFVVEQRLVRRTVGVPSPRASQFSRRAVYHTPFYLPHYPGKRPPGRQLICSRPPTLPSAAGHLGRPPPAAGHQRLAISGHPPRRAMAEAPSQIVSSPAPLGSPSRRGASPCRARLERRLARGHRAVAACGQPAPRARRPCARRGTAAAAAHRALVGARPERRARRPRARAANVRAELPPPPRRHRHRRRQRRDCLRHPRAAARPPAPPLPRGMPAMAALFHRALAIPGSRSTASRCASTPPTAMALKTRRRRRAPTIRVNRAADHSLARRRRRGGGRGGGGGGGVGASR